MEFDYPINYDLYSADELAIIINFLDIVEKCYEKGVSLVDYKYAYKGFKNIVSSKSEENNILKKYKEITGFDGYLTTKEMKKEVAEIKF